MPFQKKQPITFITIPGNAGPGEARIVITSVLPAPLVTYTFTDRAGYLSSYAGGIILYSDDISPPLDTTYTYFAVVANEFGSFTAVHMGHVFNGAVREISAGVPAVQIWGGEAGSVLTQKWLTAGMAVLEAYSGTGEAIVRGLNGALVRITTDSGADIIVNAGGANAGISLTAADIITLLSALSTTISTTTGSITLDANGSGADVLLTADDDIVLTAADDINFDAGGELQIQGTRAYMLTQIQTNKCNAALAPVPLAFTLVPNCSITLPTVTTNARYKVSIGARMGMNPAGGPTLLQGRVLVDGVAAPQIISLFLDEIQSENHPLFATGTLAAVGNHTFTFEASDVFNTAVCDVAVDTTITVEIFESGG